MNNFNISKNPDSSYALAQKRHSQIKFSRLLGNELALMKHIATYMRTMEAARIVPSWEALKDTETWWHICKQLDSTEIRKYRAWWNLIFECRIAGAESKDEMKKEGAIFSFLVFEIARESVRRSGSGWNGPDRIEMMRLFEISEDKALKVEESVQKRFQDLMPGRDFEDSIT